MSAILIEKLRKARQSVVELEGFKFTIRRPTDAEAASLPTLTLSDVATRFVVGWEGVKEIDLIPGGNPVEVPFNSMVWGEWCADRPDFWAPITDAVLASYRQHRGAVEEEAKN